MDFTPNSYVLDYFRVYAISSPFVHVRVGGCVATMLGTNCAHISCFSDAAWADEGSGAPTYGTCFTLVYPLRSRVLLEAS